MIELAGLIAAAALLGTLIALEIRRAGPDTGPHPGLHTGPPARPKLLGRAVGPMAVTVMWAMYVILFLPRVLGLLA
jgi:hypothetical protein